MRGQPPLAPILTAGIVLGIGLGGFFDGIVFHQLLQWHHMISSQADYPVDTLRGLQVNTTWDGAFHMTTWVVTLIGLGLLWRAESLYDVRWSAVLVGAVLMGWGGFNLADGFLNHHILGIHHVRDDLGGPLIWDVGFLLWGGVMLVGGWALVQVRQTRAVENGRRQQPSRARFRGRAAGRAR